jgi:hypothetical protein
MTPAAAIIDIISRARIIKIIVPAIAAADIARAVIGVIIAAAVIAAANTHPAIAIAIVIGATAQCQRASQANGGQKPSCRSSHRLSPYPLAAWPNAWSLNWL